MEKFKFEHLSAKDIHDYMMEHATDKQKKEFKEAAFINNKKKVAETIIGEDGNPVMYQVLDKNKKPKFDKHGNPIMRARTKMKETDKEAEKKFSLLDAKKWFKANFPDAVEDNTKPKASDCFKDW